MLTTIPDDDVVAPDRASGARVDDRALRAAAGARITSYAPIERYGYQPSRSGRLFGGVGSAATCALFAIGLFVTLGEVRHAKRPPTTLTVTLLPATTPQPPRPKPVARPRPVEQTVQALAPTPVVPIAAPVLLPAPQTPLPQPAAADPQAVAPSPPAAAAASPQPPASHGPDKWEGRVLARLERFRRYPPDAEHARQQGIAYIRFRIDRSGHVLSASLERSSGIAALDQAAMETLHRADPLPQIPPDRPDEIEITVPIEFSIRH